PDDRARSLARARLFGELDRALAEGNLLRVRIVAERSLQNYREGNLLRLSAGEGERLQSLLELATEAEAPASSIQKAPAAAATPTP
ncbi:MAG: hypothetical protein KDB94_04245, partial [Acidobacteria bacterium]|nr:hypothetical protein [Acidobacteriota bacterium]